MFRTIVIPIAAVLMLVCISEVGNTQAVHPGKTLYDNNCLTCHQADGSGVPGMNPPLSNVDWVTGNKERLIRVVINGLTTPLEIDGETYHNPMPSHKHLTDKEVADVLSYIRSSFGNKATAVTAEEVKKIRAKK